MTTTISYPCGRCGRRHDFAPELAGAWVSCEECDADFQLPVPRGAAPAPGNGPGAGAPPAVAEEGPTSVSRAVSPPAPGHVKFPCGICNQRYEVPATLSGRRFKCKKCGASVTVPWVAQAAEAPAPPAPQAPPPPRPARPLAAAPAPAARSAPPMQFKPAPQAASFSRPAPPPEPEAPVFAYEEADEVEPAFAFLDEDAQTQPKSRSSDPYGLDEGRPSPRSGSGPRPGSSPEPEFVLPQRVAPRKGKTSKAGSSGGRGWAIGGGLGGGAVGLYFIVRVVFIAIRLGMAGGLGGGDTFAANEARLEQAHQDYLSTFNQLIDVFGSIHDVPSAMQADPRAQGLLRQMGELNRTAMGVRVSKPYLDRMKLRMQSEAQVEGQKLAAQLLRVGMIPGVRPALQGTFNELQRLAQLEQAGMRNMGVQ